MEATAQQYREWKKEKRHREYLRDCNPGYKVVSYDAIESEDEGCNGEELLRDEDSGMESVCFGRFELDALLDALALLSVEERQIVEYFFLSDAQGTERGYSALTGIPQKTINDRKKRVLAKLKNFLEQ